MIREYSKKLASIGMAATLVLLSPGFRFYELWAGGDRVKPGDNPSARSITLSIPAMGSGDFGSFQKFNPATLGSLNVPDSLTTANLNGFQFQGSASVLKLSIQQASHSETISTATPSPRFPIVVFSIGPRDVSIRHALGQGYSGAAIVSHTSSQLSHPSLYSLSSSFLMEPLSNAISHVQGLSSGNGTIFDGSQDSAKLSSAEPGTPLQDSISRKNITLVIVRPGHPPLSLKLERLSDFLRRNPEFKDEFNRHGHYAIVEGDGLEAPSVSSHDRDDLQKIYSALGLQRKSPKFFRREVVPFLRASSKEDSDHPKTTITARAPSFLGTRFRRFLTGIPAIAYVVYFTFFGDGFHGAMENLPGLIILSALLPNGDRFVDNFKYAMRMLKASFKESKWPRWNEILGGFIGKVVPALINILVFAKAFASEGIDLNAKFSTAHRLLSETISVASASGWTGSSLHALPTAMGALYRLAADLAGIFQGMVGDAFHSHPIALISAILLSLSIEIFHGIFTNAWDTFQNKAGRDRGPAWQNNFNFIYGASISSSFRAISYFALGSAFVSAPWTTSYWVGIFIMTVIGTLCGTLGYRGLNELYEKRRLGRMGRVSIQQLRDFGNMLIGPMYSTGNILGTIISFCLMQGTDLLIFVIDKMAKTRPTIIATDSRLAESEMFQGIYFRDPHLMHEVMHGITGFLLVKYLLLLIKAIFYPITHGFRTLQNARSLRKASGKQQSG